MTIDYNELAKKNRQSLAWLYFLISAGILVLLVGSYLLSVPLQTSLIKLYKDAESEIQTAMESGNNDVQVVTKPNVPANQQPKTTPQEERLYNNAVDKYNLGYYPVATSELKKVLKLNPDFFEANLFLAELLWMQADSAGALIYAQKAVELEPTDARAHAMLGTAQLNTGDREGAVASYRKAVQLNPENVRYKQTLESIDN